MACNILESTISLQAACVISNTHWFLDISFAISLSREFICKQLVFYKSFQKHIRFFISICPLYTDPFTNDPEIHLHTAEWQIQPAIAFGFLFDFLVSSLLYGEVPKDLKLHSIFIEKSIILWCKGSLDSCGNKCFMSYWRFHQWLSN